MSASEAFRLRTTPGQRRHDRVFAIGSHEHVRLESWCEVRPNDLLFLGDDSVTGEVSHLDHGMEEIVTSSGTICRWDVWTPAVARPLAITFVCHPTNALIYASGQEWNDPSYALEHDFNATEWRYVSHDDPWHQSLNFGENITIPRVDLPSY